MTRSTLAEVLGPAFREGFAVAAFDCLGWEDAQAFVVAAETEGVPVILQVGPEARAHTPLPVIATMFRTLADAASVPVALHLDRAKNADECHQGIDEGFTSVMLDSSRRNLEDNIVQTARVVQMARRAGVSIEGEVEFVDTQLGSPNKGTDPNAAAIYARETGVDALSISLGRIQEQNQPSPQIDEVHLAELQKTCQRPLVLRAGSNFPNEVRSRLARSSNICKVNIDTEVRMAFGLALRQAFRADPKAYDRIALLTQTHEPLVTCARRVIRGLMPGTE